jgi:hypothetical protein
MKKQASEAVSYLREKARGPEDLEIAKLVERLGEVYEIAREVVVAKTHDHSKAAYSELVDVFRGKRDV